MGSENLTRQSKQLRNFIEQCLKSFTFQKMRTCFYKVLRQALKDRFGDGHLEQVYYLERQGRQQQYCKTLAYAVLAANLAPLTTMLFHCAGTDTLNLISTIFFFNAIGD